MEDKRHIVEKILYSITVQEIFLNLLFKDEEKFLNYVS